MQQQARVAIDDFQLAPFLGRDALRRQPPGHRAEDQGQRRSQLVADVGEEARLQFVHVARLLVQPRQLLVGLLQPCIGLGQLSGNRFKWPIGGCNGMIHRFARYKPGPAKLKLG